MQMMKEEFMKRTQHMKALAAVFLLGGWLWSGAGAVWAQGKGASRVPVKHILLFIGDGMQLEHEIAASRYLAGKDWGLAFHKFPRQFDVSTWDVTTYNKYAQCLGLSPYDAGQVNAVVGYDPRRGGARPYPLQRAGIEDSYFVPAGNVKPFATDSSSAATAWATGYKTDDGNLAWLPGDPPDGKLPTIAEILRDKKGFAVGVVSTVPFTHATPAAHVSHNVSRNNYHAIAAEILEETRPEVVIGGGHPGYDGGSYMSPALYGEAKSGSLSDYVFIERTAGQDGSLALLTAAQTAADQGMKLFGLFGGKDGNFESPLPHDLPGTPLVQRTTLENPLLRDAVLAALKVLSRDPDGFFAMFEQGDIDWANHGNDYRRMIGCVWDLNEAVKAAVEFVDQPGDGIDWENTLLIVTSDHSNSYMRLSEAMTLGAGDLPEQLNALYPGGEVSYGTTQHTNELVRLYALGDGGRLFTKYRNDWYPKTKIIDNTHLFHVMAEAAGAPQRPHLQIVK
jgi:alkaline phosphatase